MKKTIFIKNAAVLTATGIALRFAGVIFKIWLAKLIGSEGVGLYQVIFSVYAFASTFATSGISTAVTKLCADELCRKNMLSVKKTVKTAVFLSLVVAFVSLGILWLGADFIAAKIISDKRAALSIKVLAFALPFMGMCSCFRGYFIARRKVVAPAFAQITEQVVRIAVVSVFVNLTFKKGLYYCCAAIFLGDSVSEFVSCVILYIVYKFDIIKISTQNICRQATSNIKEKIGETAIPISLGRYLNSALRTCENVIAPRFLKLFKGAKDSALSQFGMIKGMALPLIFFPSTLLNSLSTLLIPELSEAKSQNRGFVIKSIVSRTVSLTATVSYVVSAVFFVCGEEIGILIYKNQTVGVLIRLLSPLVPLMYLDSICDGMLKGLNLQRFTFFTSVSDSAIRIVLLIFVLPKFGLMGFIGIMYFSNAYTALLNVRKLINVAGATFEPMKTVVLPLLCAFLSVFAVDLAVKRLFYSITSVYIMLVFGVSAAVYLILLKKTVRFDVSDFL